MTTVQIPLSTYRISQNKPSNRYGSPASLPLGAAEHRILMRGTLDKVPVDATISSAKVRVYFDKAATGTKNVKVQPITSSWSSSVTWKIQPTVDNAVDSVNVTDPGNNHMVELDVTNWANTRSRRGLRLDSDTATPSGIWISGSSAPDQKPVLVVVYSVSPVTPGELRPDGGLVSVASPILTYAGDRDMTQQKIQFSTDGITASYDSGWLSATSGYYDPSKDTGGPPVLANGGTGIYWRAITNGPTGQSDPSEWAFYQFASLDVPVITSPGATTDDGTPVLQWTVGSQDAWRAWLYSGSKIIDSIGWQNEPATRDWTPSKGVKVPDASARFELEVKDGQTPRVIAMQAPVSTLVTHDFTTVLNGTGTAIDTLTYDYEEPVPVLSGTRALGVPDEVALVRDGKIVPLWTPDGAAYPTWAPGSAFFTGTNFTIRDFTSDPRHEHTWSVRVRVNGAASGQGPTVTQKPTTPSVWLIDPRTNQKVEVLGYGDIPSVDMSTDEASIVHVPLNGGKIVEPKRRRLNRTTKSGSISGSVLNEHEDILDAWIEDDSALKYRLVFGKVNWPVILGDYNPGEVFYGGNCGPNRVVVACNWWQRLTDI